ncbi:TonB-dependent receptor [Burkholderia aenigmatica]|uniref:TonB-dependent receptor n=1 Tax=Burkholderia aenigmatica TaxID=2015348 RepID=UPI00265217A7|nr:TonB-dependent receptor [Burkholderia aenigmatica]MDN7876882.1 TonB-dependent receptor [Burkholderia aenigmatica]
MASKKGGVAAESTIFRRTLVAVTVMRMFLAASDACAQTEPAQPGAGTPPPAAATERAAPATDRDGNASAKGRAGGAAITLNSVEVTANRRREPAREVPMKVDTLSSDALQKSGATKLSDYLSTQPGVGFNSGGGPGQGTISMRGVTAGKDVGPTVGVYVDDTPLGSNTVSGGGAALALDMGLLDLNHIEILFGPQGTLYGAGAMGGLLKYVTNQPDTESFFGSVGTMFSSTWHGGLNNTTNVVLNVPLKSDVAAMRIAAFNNHDGGYVDATGAAAGTRINRSDTTGVRASLLVTPTRKLTFRFTATLQNINSNGQNYVDYGMNGRPAYGALTKLQDSQEPYHQSNQFYTANAEYDFGWARLNAISAYQSLRTSTTLDFTPFYAPILAAGGLDVSTVTPSSTVGTNKVTQELRLTSPGNRTLEWVAGLYYDHEHSNTLQVYRATAGGRPLGDLERLGYSGSYQELAAYGDVTYNPTSRIALTAGMRIAHNSQDYRQETFGLLVPTPLSAPGTSSDTSKTYMFTASYKLTPTSNVYARVASGYRPGGPNSMAVSAVTGQLIAGNPTYKPDTLWNYEIGYKADLFDNRVSVALSAYDIEWHDIQQYGAVDGVAQLVNAGNARIKGLEATGVVRPTSALSFNASLAAIDAYLTEGASSVGARTGDRLPNTAKFAASLGASWRFPLGPWSATASAAERFVGERHASFAGATGSPDFILPAYAVTDLQLGVDLRYASLSFFVRNLFNREGLLSANTSYVPLGGNVWASVIQPRTIGVQLSAPF